MLEANQRFAESFDKGDLEIPPARNIAVLTCIDDHVDRIRSLGQIPADATVSGHVYDVRTGTLREVIPAG